MPFRWTPFPRAQVEAGLNLLVDALQLNPLPPANKRASMTAHAAASGGPHADGITADGRMQGHVLPPAAATLRRMAARCAHNARMHACAWWQHRQHVRTWTHVLRCWDAAALCCVPASRHTLARAFAAA